MTTTRPEYVQWLGPTPPLRTGIANYTQDFFQAVDGLWPILSFLEAGSQLDLYRTIRDGGRRNPDPALPTLIHVGNSEYHERAFEVGRRVRGVLVLHDVVLHHALAAYSLRTGRSRQYWRDLERLYRHAGVEFGRSFLGGRNVGRFEEFPLSEPFIERALATIVHSSYAAEAVSRHSPDADVRVVPMGIPIPAVVSRDIARAALGLPASAFVVASISHVNPNKRLPVVLRALRRLVARTRDVLFVIAGTGADSGELRREVQVLGLARHVVQLGYVDERTARLLASAADACVNLRYPTTGETSASLLRLLGAGLPVLVSDAGTSSELPDGVGLKIPVDSYEVDMIAEVLWRLGDDKVLRDDAGRAARDYVVSNHTMRDQVNGYRRVIQDCYGCVLPSLNHVPVEKPPETSVREAAGGEDRRAVASVASAIAELGLSTQGGIVASTAQAIVELGLDVRGASSADPSPRLLSRLSCSGCGGTYGEGGRCHVCRRPLPITAQLPDLR